jgi:hypothetical protein
LIRGNDQHFFRDEIGIGNHGYGGEISQRVR